MKKIKIFLRTYLRKSYKLPIMYLKNSFVNPALVCHGQTRPRLEAMILQALVWKKAIDIDFSSGAHVFISACIIHSDTGGNLFFSPNNSQIF